MRWRARRVGSGTPCAALRDLLVVGWLIVDQLSELVPTLFDQRFRILG
jgi:hypothetical protein